MGSSASQPFDESNWSPGIPAGLLETLNSALQVIWEGLGPGGRNALREFQRMFAELEEGDDATAFRELLNRLSEEITQALREPDLIIYGDMPAEAADRILERHAEDETSLADRVLRVHMDPEAVAEVSDALRTATVSVSQRERLSAGLAALSEPGVTWAVPCDLLFGGIEGMLWDLGESREVFVEDREGLPRDRKERVIKSVNGMLAPEVGLDIPQRLNQFLARRLFGAYGHNVRHRRLAELQRDWTAYALVALRGLLDHLEGHDLIGGMGRRLSHMIEADTRS